MMKTEMSSPEPSRSLVILQPRSRSTPRARITRSCAAIVYLRDTGKAVVIPTPASAGRQPANCTPVKVVGVTVGQEGGHGFCYFLVGENVPESICPHDQDVVGAVLVVRQVINFNLKQQREPALHAPRLNQVQSSADVSLAPFGLEQEAVYSAAGN